MRLVLTPSRRFALVQNVGKLVLPVVLHESLDTHVLQQRLRSLFTVFITKSGDLKIILRVRGVDYLASTKLPKNM